MTRFRTRQYSSQLAVAVGLLWAGCFLHGEAAAQELTVRGRVLGPDHSGLPGQRVMLHRVAASGGATVAEDSSDATGNFDMRAPASADTSAVYFVAARYEGELYIGPPFKPERGTSMNQLLQVGVPGTSADALLRGEPSAQPAPLGRPATSRSWLLLLIPLLGVAAIGLYTLVPRTRIPADRALLIRIAELDERMNSATAAQRDTLRMERERLVEQIRAG